MNDQPGQATPAELRESKRRCWTPDCTRTAWLRDWGGWHWCWRHAIRNAWWGGGNRWHDLRTLRPRWPF